MNRRIFTLCALAILASCSRPAEQADVKLTGVGMNPDEVGPSPTPYGGVVEYDHVELAGAGLPLAFLGLSGYDEVGPNLLGFAPPYSGVFAFSYIFDQKLASAATLSQVIPVPPVAPDSCYTAFEPSGPLGSFTTVDVGDSMDFTNSDGERVMRIGRVPADFPPNAQDLFVYYIQFESYAPSDKTYLAPNPDDPSPFAMVPKVFRKANFPFGEELSFSFPGGFSGVDQPVGSIPRPSSSVADNSLQLPSEVGPVMLEWNGPRYAYDYGAQTWNESEAGDQKTCFEFYRDGTQAPADLEGCATPGQIPSSENLFESFKGQLYTGPWDTEDGSVTFKWEPDGTGDIILSVRFLAELDTSSPDLSYASIPMSSGGARSAQPCESDEAEFIYNEAAYTDGGGQLKTSVWGDPFSRMAEVTCRLDNDGEFKLTEEMLQDAMEHGMRKGIGGVVFFMARGTEAEANFPAVKDQYDQRHDINPVRLAGRAVRVGRFSWPVPGQEG